MYFIFAPQGMQYVRAYDSLKSVCDEVALKAPARITSVSMRKYMATLTQVRNFIYNKNSFVVSDGVYSVLINFVFT